MYHETNGNAMTTASWDATFLLLAIIWTALMVVFYGVGSSFAGEIAKVLAAVWWAAWFALRIWQAAKDRP